MKKFNFLCICLGLTSINAYAGNDLFQPKNNGVSEKELGLIVQKKLGEQRIELENQFQGQIDSIRQNMNTNQNQQIQDILTRLDSLQQENQLLKDQINNNSGSYSVGANDTIVTPTYTKSELEEELGNILVEASVEEDTFILAEDIIRLNKEFGENSLTFVGIIDNHKMYKNSNGEYIVKGLDFEYDGSQQAFDDSDTE